EGLDLVPLDGGGFGELPHGFLAEHGHRVAALVAARRPDGEVPPALLPDLAAIARALDEPPPPGLERLRPLIEGFESLPRAPLPADLRADLRDYQRVGIDWLCFLREAGLGALLADDMGLGKTLQTIAALSGRTLVVAPRSVVPNWQAELARFRPALRVALHEGVGRPLDPTADVVLTTHALLRLDEESLGTVPWDTLVIDEAQAIKNPESQTAQAAFSLRARFRVALSGTPVENRLEELYSLVHFTNPGLLGGLRDFREGLAARIASGDPAAAATLRARLRPFLLRRKKSEVLRELPPRTDHVVPVALLPAERATYDAVRAATRSEVLKELAAGGSVLRALEALLRLRQAACHPALLPGQQAESSSKTEALVDLLLDAAANGHRSLVFSQWTSFLDLVEPALREAGLAFLRLDGSTRDRAGVVAEFQAEGGPPVLLLSLKAGGTGLNLTAADHVFLLDPWWNPAVEDQAADRAHRIGQDRPVLVHRLVARDTVEERLLTLQDKKRALAAAALDGGAAAGLTRDDLLALLE
ncbi:MAG: DEAD/DEAH box helicase, partial [Deltaproteobacteria bacterium]|nr:DEAD/DEAH box helicase [Deltaproteobacteria bacterium]